MKAVQLTGFGGPEVVRIGDAPVPTAGPGQLLVRAAAAGVNPVDWKIREGYMKDFFPFVFPCTLGNEMAGTVEALGEGVEGFAVGDAVFGSTGPTGSWAELVAIDAASVAKKPASLSMAEAAALPVAVVTTAAALSAGEVGKGTRILIHAAAGGVGTIALQMARLKGAEVTALTSPQNMDFIRGLGAQHVVDRTSDYDKKIGDFDVVLDAYGPEAQTRSWPLLRPGGILVTLTAPPDQEAATAHGVRATMVFGGANGAALKEAAGYAESGDLKVSIARTYAIDQAVEAMAEVQGGQVRGKVVLTI